MGKAGESQADQVFLRNFPLKKQENEKKCFFFVFDVIKCKI